MTANDILIADLIAANVDPILVVRVRAVIEQLERVTLRHAMELVTEPVRSDRSHRSNRSSNRSNRSNRSDEVEVETDWPSDYPDRFWKAYPHKIGKADALKVLDRLLKRDVLWEDLWAGLQRYVAKQDDRPWCNPATWLRQERWLDEPAEVVQQRFAGRPPRPGSREDRAERTHHAYNRLDQYLKNHSDDAAAGGGLGEADAGFVSGLKSPRP